MKIIKSLLLLTAIFAPSFLIADEIAGPGGSFINNSASQQSKQFNVSSGTFRTMLKVPRSITPPPSDCTTNSDWGKIYIDTNATSGQVFYACEGSGGWKQQGGSGSGGGYAIEPATVTIQSNMGIKTSTLTMTMMTPGSILFVGVSSNVSQDNQNLYFNDSLNRVGIGTTTPVSALHIVGDLTVGHTGLGIDLRRDTYDEHYIGQIGNGLSIKNATDGRTDILIDGSGNIGINNTSPSKTLDITGTARVSSTFTVTDKYISINGTDYTWNAGSGGSGQFLRNVNGVIESVVPAGGGSSSLEVFSNFDGVSSTPTPSISVGDPLKLSVSGSTAIVTVDFSSVASRGQVILNQNTLQTGSTFYVSSGTVKGQLTIRTGNPDPGTPAYSVMELQATNSTSGSNRIESIASNSNVYPNQIITRNADGTAGVLFYIGPYTTGEAFSIRDFVSGNPYWMSGVGRGSGNTIVTSTNIATGNMSDYPTTLSVIGDSSTREPIFGAYSNSYGSGPLEIGHNVSTFTTRTNFTSSMTLSGGVLVQNVAPSSGQVLKYNGTNWAPGTDNNSGGGGGTTIWAQEGGSDVVQTSTINLNAAQFNGTDSSGKFLITIDTMTAGGIMALSTGTNAAGQLVRLDVLGDVPDANLSAQVSLLGSQIDISAETNLTVAAPITLTGDIVGLNQHVGTNVEADMEEETHATEHQDGGDDEISVTGLSGLLADRQKVAISTSGTLVAVSSSVNFAAGSNASVTGTTNSDGSVTITYSATAGGGGASTLAVGTGTASNFTTSVTSPTAAISLLGSDFGSIASGTTNFVTIKRLYNQTFLAAQANLPGANSPYISNSTNSSRPGVFFDETSTQTVTWSGILSPYSGGPLTAQVVFLSSATSGTMNWGVYVECITPNADAVSGDTDSFGVINSTSVTVGGTSMMANKASVTLTNEDSCAEGDAIRFKLERSAQSSDTAIGKGRVWYLNVKE